MTCNQFEGLLTFLHIVDRVTEEKLYEYEDKLAKVRPLIEHSMKKVLSTCCWVEHRWKNGTFNSPFFLQAVYSQRTKWGFKLCACVMQSPHTPQSLLYTVGKQAKLELPMDLRMMFSIWPDTVWTRGTDRMWTIITLVQHWPLISTAVVLTLPELWKLEGLVFLKTPPHSELVEPECMWEMAI